MYKLVKVRNEGDTDFVGKYNSQLFPIKAGAETVVPYECLCLWAGNPDVQDTGPRSKDRTDEYQRLRVKYGAYDDEEKFQSVRPQLVFHDLEDNRLVTVMEDPYGKENYAKPQVFGSQDVGNVISQMQAQLQSLVSVLTPEQLEQLNLTRTGTQLPTAVDELPDNADATVPPEDTPNRVRVSGK